MVLDGHPVLILVCVRHVYLEPRYDLSDKECSSERQTFLHTVQSSKRRHSCVIRPIRRE